MILWPDAAGSLVNVFLLICCFDSTVACGDNLCRLCEKSPERRCGVHCLKEKYSAGKGLVAKCDETLSILLKHDSTGEVAKVNGDVVISLMSSQCCTAYFQDRRVLCSEDFSRCLVDQVSNLPSSYSHLLFLGWRNKEYLLKRNGVASRVIDTWTACLYLTQEKHLMDCVYQ